MAGDRVDRLALAAVAVGRARVDDDELGQARGELLGVDQVVGALVRDEVGGLGLLLAGRGAGRASRRSPPRRRGRSGAGATRAARAPLPVGDREDVRADPGARGGRGELLRGRQRVAAAAPARAGEVGLEVEEDGAGDVRLEVERARPAPGRRGRSGSRRTGTLVLMSIWGRSCGARVATASWSTSTSGWSSASAAAHVSDSPSRAQTITVGPEPESVAPSALSGRRRAHVREERRAVRLVQPVVRARRRRAPPSRTRARRRAAPRGRRVNAASACGTVSGSAAREAAVLVRPGGTSAIGSAGTSSAIRAIARLPGQADAAGERGREVVAVALERRARARAAPRRPARARRRARPRRARARSRRRSSRGPARAGSGS